MSLLTLITLNGIVTDGSKKTMGYTLLTHDYQIVNMNAAELKNAILSKKSVVTNVDVQNDKLVATNGAFDKYTFINMNTGMVEGTARAVILNRVEQNNKLVGYTVFTQNGKITDLSVKDASVLANKKMISNGKVRHTADGDIVSAIGGTYPLRELKVEQAPDGEITIKIGYFGTSIGADTDYFSALISCTSAAQLYKLDDALSKSNAKVVASTAKVAGQSIRSKLGWVRVGANDIAGSFELDILDKLLKAKKVKVELLMGNNMSISAFKYGADGSVDESKVELDKAWKVTGKTAGSTETVEKVKKYVQKVTSRFNKVAIQ